ncbi:YkvI family membrane protein [Sutcliffiella horikoshii]|uniref:YkvI family membrane protein n=1 Tax=Sutcliffiella horikoshii TaxID=79883 RepID=UPI003CE941F4
MLKGEEGVAIVKRSWLSACQIGAVYVGTIVGAGFATGKEIVQFFTQYGWIGIITILMSGFLFIWLGTKMMLISKRIKANSYKEFNEYLFGMSAGTVVNLFMLVILICVGAVMLSGAGAVFEEQLGWSFQLGLLLTVVLSVCVVLFGVKGLVGVNVIVVPVMIIFSFIIAGNSIAENGLSFLSLDPVKDSLKGWLAPFMYVSFNLAMAQPVLVPLAMEAKDDWVIKRGGFIGGLVLCFILLTCHISIASLPEFHTFEIPMAEVVKLSMLSFFGIYVFVIYGEIFTSVVSDIFGLQRQLESMLNVSRYLVTVVLVSIIYMISQIGYGSLIEHLYPFFGYVSMAFLVLLVVRK